MFFICCTQLWRWSSDKTSSRDDRPWLKQQQYVLEHYQQSKNDNLFIFDVQTCWDKTKKKTINEHTIRVTLKQNVQVYVKAIESYFEKWHKNTEG